MVLVQKWPFFQLFFLGNIGQENVFYDILEQKKAPFYPMKTRSSKSRKIDIFPMGLNHGFGPKMTIFPPFFLGKNSTKMGIIGPKPWVNPLGKMSIFGLFEVLVSIAQQGVFRSRIS